MEIKPEVTLVIFTHDNYLDILPAVIEGTKNIQDEIVKRYIVSPNKIDVPGFCVIRKSRICCRGLVWNRLEGQGEAVPPAPP